MPACFPSGCHEKKGQVREAYRYSGGNTWQPKTPIPSSFPDFPCHPSPPLCLLFSSFSTSSILSHCFTPPPPSHACAWLLMGVRPPEYPASPSLTNTYPLGNASTLVPGSFSVNTSLFLVCAKYLLTSISLFRSLKQDSGAER